MANQPAAGWYPDPKDPGQRRYWDGTKWTEHTQAQPAQAPQQAPQPAPAARPARPSPQAPAQSPRAPAQAAPPQAAPAQRPPQAPPAPAAPPARPAPPGPEGPPGGYVAPMPPGGVRPAWTGAPLAGWGHRVGATIIDGLITSIPFVIGIALILGGKGGLGLLLYLLGLVAAFVYYPLTMSRPAPRNGQTIGKQVVGIRVSKDD